MSALAGLDFNDASSRAKLKVAIVHYWLVGMRGGERVLEAICEMFPQADIFTHVYDEKSCGEAFGKHKITETKIGRLPFAKTLYQAYLPFMPGALEELDLTGYDLIISSEAGPAKGVIPPPDALHICYVHSPMRYIWDQYHQYKSTASLPARLMMPLVAPRLRQWDVTSAARVDYFIANSTHVANRVKKYWRRNAAVIHPPVSIEEFTPAAPEEIGDYYLWLGELAPYKRPDLAIEAFNQNGKKLIIIGGPEKARKKLRRLANDNITFLGKADFSTVKHMLARCRALIFPGEEDFGIVPVEALASGRPVIAYGRGGILDSVTDGETGVFFREQTVEALVEAVERFESQLLETFDAGAMIRHAEGFSEMQFKNRFTALLADNGIDMASEETGA